MLIAQLSDPHVVPEGARYHGLVDSNGMFRGAIAQLNALRPAPDVVVISGDLVDGGTAEEYRLVRQLLGAIQQPLLILPGNHDERGAFREAFGDLPLLAKAGPLHFVADGYGPLRVVGLDVTVPGFHHGDFDAAAEAWLEPVLAKEPERPTLIVMHPPPFESGIGFLDPYRCFGGERLAALVSGYPAVEAVLCGHVHRLMQVRFGGTVAMTAPSTASAIALKLEPGAAPASLLEPPGLLLHHWREGEGLVTHLVPIGDFGPEMAFF